MNLTKVCALSLYVLACILVVSCGLLAMKPAPAPLTPPPPVEETPIGKVSGAFNALAQTLNQVNADGVVTPDEVPVVQAALQGTGKGVVDAVQTIEQNLRAELNAAQEQGGSIDWPSTLLGAGLSLLTGGGLVRAGALNLVPNRKIIGTEPDPEVARVAGLHEVRA